MAERTVPLFSIGAVARMLDLSAATIRTWETRYGYVIPQRSGGGQRLYSRDQVDQLRFVKDEVDGGRRPGEAHRLLAERVDRGDSFGGTRLRVLVAESRIGASAVLKELFGTDAFEVLVASDPEVAGQVFDELSPAVVVVDADDRDFDRLTERIRAAGVKVLPIDLLERPLALLDKARPVAR
ncbi:MAG: MerR family transcriptional regulator, light-induced transcriptional regulator [Actinomycetota bacterium]|nr:MerR family transcriptional regulator, light-induced transcriptional regulator [Actinomycetota bacterium]